MSARQQVTLDPSMPYPVPIPGSSPARLIDAGIAHFQQRGYEGSSVVEIATDAGVTTGSLYHHFDSKRGLYLVILEEMQRRMIERIEGAAAARGGMEGVLAAFRVTLAAGERFGVTRILSESPNGEGPIAAALSVFFPERDHVGTLLAAMWREAMHTLAEGANTDEAMRSIEAIVAVGDSSPPTQTG